MADSFNGTWETGGPGGEEGGSWHEQVTFVQDQDTIRGVLRRGLSGLNSRGERVTEYHNEKQLQGQVTGARQAVVHLDGTPIGLRLEGAALWISSPDRKLIEPGQWTRSADA